MIVKLDGVAHLPRPGDNSANWRLPDPCPFYSCFDQRGPIGLARLTRDEDGAIHAEAEWADAGFGLVVQLTLPHRVLALGVLRPEDPEHARVVAVSVAEDNVDPTVPTYRLRVQDADGYTARLLLETALRRPDGPRDLAPPRHHDLPAYDLTAPAGYLFRARWRPLNLIGRGGKPVRCTLHPTDWIEPDGCRGCRAEHRARHAHADWIETVAEHYSEALRAAGQRRFGPWCRWNPQGPVLLAIRVTEVPGWCGIGLIDGCGRLQFHCAERDTHTGACVNRDGTGRFDGTAFHRERGSHHESH